jgi:hypothetical protein
MEQSKLVVIPPHLVHQYWHFAEPHLKKAIDKGEGEFDLATLEYACSRGEQTLLLVMNNGECHCALTVIRYNFPKFQSMYITYIGGNNTKEGWEQFKQWVKGEGCDRITGSAVTQSIVKLWQKYYGFKPKYTFVELILEE